MLKYPELTEARILKTLPEIQAAIHGPRQSLNAGAWHVDGEPVSWDTASRASYTPFAVGEAWGPLWGTTWFRVSGTVPEGWSAREVVVLMRLTDQGREGFSGEGLVYCNGSPVRALNIHRNEIEVARAAKGGEAFEFFIEAGSNFAHPGGKIVAGGDRCLFTLAQLELACVNRAIFDLYHDFKAAADAMAALPQVSQRRAELREGLNDCLNILDLADERAVRKGREILSEVLRKKNGESTHEIAAIGHAHIDTAWLWPLRETIRKCARTFSTALDYMKTYPDYVFGCSQAQQYAWMKAHYPEIYEGIKERVRTKQWEPIGSMWIEPDCNLASGESLIRQILHGKQFFQEEFGYETRDAWIPDVFGYSASLPQIFRKCGIDYFLTQKISWNQFNKFPHHTFLWEGIDGSQIFTHFPPADTYNARMTPKELLYNVENFREHGRTEHSLYVYGFGDGGGGPTIDMLEQARRFQDFAGLPKVRQQGVLEFFEQAGEDAKKLSVWVGELYLELHRGTYTTQSRIKRHNRKAEFLLQQAEFLDAVSGVLVPDREEKAADPQRARYDTTGLGGGDHSSHQAALKRAWNLVLLNQFHDIIPGSSIGWVYKDSEADYAAVRELGNSVVASSLSGLDFEIDTIGMERPIRALNTLSFGRTEIVPLADGSLHEVSVPPCGYAVFDGQRQSADVGAGVTVGHEAGQFVVENGLLRLCIGEDGLIKSIWDFEASREVLTGDGNLLQLHPDNPVAWDAWDIDAYYMEKCQDLRAIDGLDIEERNPLRVKIRIERSFGQSRMKQRIVMKKGSRRIDFETEIDWQEEHKLLRVAFPVDLRSSRASYEIQFGHVERPTHYNTSWDLARFEVCGHRWADLSEEGYGVALLNDCKYGYDIHGSTLRLSLLRSPTAPDPTADKGRHTFTYALLPHTGTLQQGKVIEEAYRLNVPLLVNALPVRHGQAPASRSFFEISEAGVVLETVKMAEEGRALVLRVYEAYGARKNVELRTSLAFQKATRTDLLEREECVEELRDGALRFSIKPFEIVTFKLHL